MNRRSFLTISSFISAGLISGFPKAIEARPTRKIGLSLRGWSAQTPENELDTLIKIKNLGFSWVELFAHSQGKNQLVDFDRTLHSIKKAGINLISCDVPLGRGEELPENTPCLTSGLESFAKKFAQAGGRFLVCSRIPQFVRQKIGDYELLAQNLNEAGEICSASGIQFCYSPGPGDFDTMNDIIPMHQLLSQCDSRTVKIKLDLGPIFKTRQSLEWLLQAHPGRFPILELKDYDPATQKLLPPGKGNFDFQGLFSQSRKAGFEWFCMEWPERKTFSEVEFSQAITYLKKIK